MAATVQCPGLNCKWQRIAKGRWQCQHCQAQHVDARNNARGEIPPPCGKFQACRATTLQQVKNYATSLARWVSSGMPQRSDAEVARIYEICRACEHFADNQCSLCGCRVSTDGAGWRNKIRMATEKCPIGKWE